jgi:hypothetical protein
MRRPRQCERRLTSLETESRLKVEHTCSECLLRLSKILEQDIVRDGVGIEVEVIEKVEGVGTKFKLCILT